MRGGPQLRGQPARGHSVLQADLSEEQLEDAQPEVLHGHHHLCGQQPARELTVPAEVEAFHALALLRYLAPQLKASGPRSFRGPLEF